MQEIYLDYNALAPLDPPAAGEETPRADCDRAPYATRRVMPPIEDR